MILYETIDFLASFLLISIILRTILSVFPSSLRSIFDVIGEARIKISSIVISLYKTESNLEVNIFGIIILPFAVFFLTFQSLSLSVHFNNDYYFVNIWIVLFLMFLFTFFAPSPTEVQTFRKITSISAFIFVTKLIISLQVMISYPEYDLYTMLFLIVPISPLFQID